MVKEVLSDFSFFFFLSLINNDYCCKNLMIELYYTNQIWNQINVE